MIAARLVQICIRIFIHSYFIDILGATWISQGVEAVLDGLQTDVAANLGTLRSKEKYQC